MKWNNGELIYAAEAKHVYYPSFQYLCKEKPRFNPKKATRREKAAITGRNRP
jgi:hypothetical protein